MTAVKADVAAVPLADLCESWLIALEAETKSPATLRAYAAGVTGFLAWYAKQGGDAEPVLDRPAVSAYLADLRRSGQSAGTCRLRYSALRLFSRWLVIEGERERDGLLTMNPPKKDDPIVPCLNDEELRALVKACRGTRFADRRDEAIVRLLAYTGCRAGEACALTVDDVDLRDRLVRIERGKGGKGRIVDIDAETARAIDRYLRLRRTHRLAHTGMLWLGDQSRPFAYQGMAQAIKRRAAKAGIREFHLHRLRHSAASRWLEAGGSEGGLMARAGWKSRDMITRYTQDTAARRAIKEAQGLNLGGIG